MSSGQMLCHLSGAFRMALRQQPCTTIPSPLNSRLGRHLSLSSPIPWPRDVRTVPELDATHHPQPSPAHFEQDLADLLTLIRHFSITPAPNLLPNHPILGPLTHPQWMRWGYLHTDHHLRQFRC